MHDLNIIQDLPFLNFVRVFLIFYLGSIHKVIIVTYLYLYCSTGMISSPDIL